MFGKGKMVDFEAQIAELNASSARRSAILSEMGRAEKAGQRVSEQLKAKPKVSLAETLKRRAEAKPKAVLQPQSAGKPAQDGKSWKPTVRLGPMLKEFYEPDPRRERELLDPWEEEAAFMRGIRDRLRSGRSGKIAKSGTSPKVIP